MSESEREGILQTPTLIESMCPQCERNGETRLMLVSIPHFKEVIVSSFSCPYCGTQNREVESAGTLAPRGCEYFVFVNRAADLNRQVLKGEHATLTLSSLQVEVPGNGGRGCLNTIEGLLRGFADDLETAACQASDAAKQFADKIENEKREADEGLTQNEQTRTALTQHFEEQQNALLERETRLREVVSRLRKMAAGEERGFWIDIRDPSGSSYIESEETVLEKMTETGPSENGAEETHSSERVFPAGTKSLDSRLYCRFFERTSEELQAMGYMTPEKPEENPSSEDSETRKLEDGEADPTLEETQRGDELSREEVLQLPVQCPHCGGSSTNNVCRIFIPGFKECLLFSFVCSKCGAKNSEIKAAGACGPAGRTWRLQVTCEADLNRDVLKSDFAKIQVPSLELEMEGGAQAGTLTTIEGLLLSISDGLKESCPFASGDSATAFQRSKVQECSDGLRRLASAETLPFELILTDPADMSFIALRTEQSSHLKKSRHVDGDAVRALAEAAAATAGGLNGAKTEEELKTLVENALPGEVISEDALDEGLTTILFRRTDEQEEALGLKDMRTEHY